MNKGIPAIDPKQISAIFPKRPRDSHKGQFGTVAVIGGDSGMVGAPILAARAALKLGAGCVHVGLLARHAPAVDMRQPELMFHPASVAMQLPGVDVFALGCGLGQNPEAQKLLQEALHSSASLVLDADALNILARHPELRMILLARHSSTVLTPHPGEAARLLDCKISEVQQDRVGAVARLAQKYGSSVVLKGTDSLCCDEKGKLHVNPTGNPGMASAGMGDVLTGMIAAFIAQGLAADDALLAAVYLHGAAADEISNQGIFIGMTASEVTESARTLLNRYITPRTT